MCATLASSTNDAAPRVPSFMSAKRVSQRSLPVTEEPRGPCVTAAVSAFGSVDALKAGQRWTRASEAGAASRVDALQPTRRSPGPGRGFRFGSARPGRALVAARTQWSTSGMEPFTVLLAIGGARGVGILVKALSGSSELGELSSELFQALTESESRVDERLSRIEGLLEEVSKQPYDVALGEGVRYLMNAFAASERRATELELARQRFITATSAAARFPLRRAIAERYLMLCLFALDRLDQVPMSIRQMEAAATAAAFDSAFTDAVIAERDWKTAAKLLNRRDAEAGRSGSQGRADPAAIRKAAIEGIAICGRLLGEAALLAPALGLPARAALPEDSGAVPMRVPVPPRESGGQQLIYTVTENPYWAFEARAGEALRVGSLSVTFAPVDDSEPATHRAARLPPAQAQWRSYIARVELDAPMSRPIMIAAATGDTRPDTQYRRPASLPYAGRAAPPPPVRTTSLWFDGRHDLQLGPGVSSAQLPIASEWPGVIKLGTPEARRPLITVTCTA